MNHSIKMPDLNGQIISYQPQQKTLPATLTAPSSQRTAFAAAHVVTDPLAPIHPSSDSQLDWEATLAYRRYLWSLGFNVAEAMDTAQRGMGLNWPSTQELIRQSVAQAPSRDRIACGVGTDHMTITPQTTLQDVIDAYLQQSEFVESQGAKMILMASRGLAQIAKKPEDYAYVYEQVLSQISHPVILHWLGDMFDPALTGYWGTTDIDKAMQQCLEVINQNLSNIEGIKISLLDKQREIDMRRLLPDSVKMYTGDDFNYPELIQGDQQGYSDALLGIFDSIAPLASAALKAFDEGDTQRYEQILAPTVPLSRHIFQKPTRFYKTGTVFLAYLNGHQNHFKMVGGLESMRSTPHFAELFKLADQAGLFTDTERSSQRMIQFLQMAGVEQI